MEGQAGLEGSESIVKQAGIVLVGQEFVRRAT